MVKTHVCNSFMECWMRWHLSALQRTLCKQFEKQTLLIHSDCRFPSKLSVKSLLLDVGSGTTSSQ